MSEQRFVGPGQGIVFLFLGVAGACVAVYAGAGAASPFADPFLQGLLTVAAWALGTGGLASVVYGLGVLLGLLHLYNADGAVAREEARQAQIETRRRQKELEAMERRWQIDLDGDGVVGQVSNPEIRIWNDPRTMALREVEHFILVSWRASDSPTTKANGLSRKAWGVEDKGPDTYERQRYEAILQLLADRPISVVEGRGSGMPGRFTTSSPDEAISIVRRWWPYVTIPQVLLENLVASQPAG